MRWATSRISRLCFSPPVSIPRATSVYGPRFGMRYQQNNNNTPTSCPHSHWLFQHMSPYSTTLPARCQRSQQLQGNAIFENIKLHFCYFFRKFFTFFKVKLFPACQCSHWWCWHYVCAVSVYADTWPHSRWLRWHCVLKVNNYADTMSA